MPYLLGQQCPSPEQSQKINIFLKNVLKQIIFHEALYSYFPCETTCLSCKQFQIAFHCIYDWKHFSMKIKMLSLLLLQHLKFPVQWVPGVLSLFGGGVIKWNTSIAQVMNEWNYTSTPPICLHGMQKDNLIFTLYCNISYTRICFMWKLYWSQSMTILSNNWLEFYKLRQT
jgi:hypothetical protein